MAGSTEALDAVRLVVVRMMVLCLQLATHLARAGGELPAVLTPECALPYTVPIARFDGQFVERRSRRPHVRGVAGTAPALSSSSRFAVAA